MKRFDPATITDYKLLTGDAATTLRTFPDRSVDCVVTSPPYWGQRVYHSAGIGREESFAAYLDSIRTVMREVKRVLTDTGSLWINLGDRYLQKDLVGIPWSIAFALKDDGWVLRQDVIWDKKRMTQSSQDRFRTMHEYLFHLVKQPKYYFNHRAVRQQHTARPTIQDGKVTSITGVTGDKYRDDIAKSSLTAKQKQAALAALEATLADMRAGRIVDFRMNVRGARRIQNSDNIEISGRARELASRGYFIATQKTEGHLPGNIWSLVPESSHRTDNHCAVFPVGLMERPVKATCPPGGVVLDPFSGTGTSVLVALQQSRRAVGIDISPTYTRTAAERIKTYMKTANERLVPLAA